MTTFNSGFGHGFEYAYFIGIYVAPLLMGVALWRSRAVPRWLAVLFFAGLEVAQQQISSGPVVILYMLPFAAAMVLLAPGSGRPPPCPPASRNRSRPAYPRDSVQRRPRQLPGRQPGTEQCLSSRLLQRRLDPPPTRGSPWQNASIQSVSGRPRDDLLNGQRFEIVVFRLPWRAAAVAVRRVAVA